MAIAFSSILFQKLLVFFALFGNLNVICSLKGPFKSYYLQKSYMLIVVKVGFMTLIICTFILHRVLGFVVQKYATGVFKSHFQVNSVAKSIQIDFCVVYVFATLDGLHLFH